MLAKVPKKRGDGRTSFRLLIAYVVRADDEPETSVETFTSCLSLHTAPAEMHAIAGRSTRVHDPVFHFVISWREGEQPTSEQAFEAGRMALDSLDMPPDDHQHVFAIHRDTDNVHLHVVVNRVSQETGRAVHPGLSYLKLDQCMREVELRQGWAHDNGPFVARQRDGQSTVERNRERLKSAARPSRAQEMEVFAGIESLAGYIEGAPKQDLLAVLKSPDATWQDVHEALARHGLELRIKGQGLAIYARDRGELMPVKASSVHEQLGKGKLEKQLGPYVEPIRAIRVSVAERSYSERDPDTRAVRREERARMRSDLKRRYGEDYAKQRNAFDTDRQRLRHQHQDEYATLLKRHRHVREQIRNGKLSVVERKAAYSISAFERARELEVLREQQRQERQTRHRPETYREWVERMAALGDEAAIAQLRGWAYAGRRKQRITPQPSGPNWIAAADSGSNARETDPLTPKRAQAMENWNWRVDTRTGNVDYLRDGERRFTDEGWAVVFASQSVQRDAMLAGLLLARQKFGSHLNATGDADFRAQTVALVVANQLDITFDDAGMEAQRMRLIQLQQAQEKAQPVQKTAEAVRRQRPDPIPRKSEPEPDRSDNGPSL
ncbi:MAG: TraI/MobA(P) family conjugative relaxase [Paraburkholderia tropica]|uniref:TraI/MobA(P) family conjugative relaxase n=1 Tax=Burkholderia gladioli TaxID=28095 RepID=UPI001641F889|nr:TraI/MobA(P) family conjugative relaxase [Burkholderia gladioli]